MSAILPVPTNLNGQVRFDYNEHFRYADLPNLTRGRTRGDNIFFENQLKYFIPEILEATYKAINARSIFPVARGAGAATRSINWRRFQQTGFAKVIADYSTDIPIVNAFGDEVSTKIRGMAVAANWSLQEIREASQMGFPLQNRYDLAARETILRLENQIAFSGSIEFGLLGLTSIGTLIPTNPAPNGSWTAATPVADIMEDLNFLVNTIQNSTQYTETPNTIIMAPTAYQLISQTYVSADSQVTILRSFLQNSPLIREVIPEIELETAGPGGTRMMTAYERNPQKLALQIPLDIEQLAPQDKGLMTEVIYHARTGGLTVFKPKSLHNVTGI